MNPIEYAAKIELEGERVYRRFAENSSINEVKALFNILADSELEHYKLFIKMKKDNIDLIDDKTLIEETNVLIKNAERKSHIKGGVCDDIYSDILEIERKMADFYESKASTSGNANLREVYGKLASEERRHQYLIESLIRFVNNPEVWLKEKTFKELLKCLLLGNK